MPKKLASRPGTIKPSVPDVSLDPLLTQDGRAAFQSLTDSANELRSATVAGQCAKQRVDVGLTQAARSTVLACRALQDRDLETLVDHARTTGLIQKASTTRAYALMRIACGRAVAPSLVSRAAKLCEFVLESHAGLDDVLPAGARFWQAFERHCGNRRTADEDRLTLSVTPDLAKRLRGGGQIAAMLMWDAGKRRVTALACEASATGEQEKEGPPPASLLIAFEPTVCVTPVPIEAEHVTRPDSLLDGLSSPIVDTGQHGTRQPTLDLNADEAVGVAAKFGEDGEAHHYTFPVNMRTRFPAEFEQLRRAGEWAKIPLDGRPQFVWRGTVTADIRAVLTARHATRVTPDDAPL